MKKTLIILLCALCLTGCTKDVHILNQNKQYTATFLDTFDTVTTVVGHAESESAFEEKVAPIREELEHYHKLFDIYHEYEDMINLKTVNDKAATSPVYVDSAIIELLSDCKEYYKITGEIFNPAMGSVLSLWHDAREDGINDPENAYLPSEHALRAASEHINPDSIMIDRNNSTVFFSDPALKLDVGAIAKGWAVERVCKNAPSGLLISVGGNVCATGPKNGGNTPWAVGIQSPVDEESYIHILNIQKGCVVTSGSYARAYTVDGKRYHHIIDPNTLYPGEKWSSVSVVCEDSGLADVLSTTLFLLDLDAGKAVLERCGGSAMWVDKEGNKHYSSDFEKLIRN